MRDFLLVLIVFGSVPLTFVRPQIGIIMWFWISLMSSHRLAWGYAQQFRLALIVGVATLIGWMISKELKRPPNFFIVYVLGAFTLWVSLAAFSAILPELAIPEWEEIIKILLMTFVTMCIVNSRERIDQLVWIIVLSIGFYGVRGGLFTILTGGNYRVWGPENTFIGDNNALALAENMVLPLMYYLRTNAQRAWVRHLLMGATGLTVISVLGSYSRGGFLGLSVVLMYFWIKSHHRVVLAIVAVAVLGVGLKMMPQQWFDRMHTIETYQTDELAEGRLQAWKFNYLLALDHPVLGGGLEVGHDAALFLHYVPEARTWRAAHSIYLQVLGETGFVGLGIFLTLLVNSLVICHRIIKSSRDHPNLAWARNLAAMLQVSVIGYAGTGTFLSLGFYDLYYALVAVIVVTYDIVRREVRASIPIAVGAVPELVGPSGRKLVPSTVQ